MTKKLEGLYAPSHAHFFPESPDQNFEIANLFSKVEKPKKYVFGDDSIPHGSGGGGLEVTNFDHCLHIVIVIGKCTDIFRWNFLALGGGYVGGSLHGGIYHERREFP